jgi:hypothetical protein
MRVEQERGYAEGQDGQPEVDEVGNPNGKGSIEEEQEISHSHVDGWACETRVKDAKANASGSESTSGGNVSSATKCQIAQNGLRIDLGGEHFKDGR